MGRGFYDPFWGSYYPYGYGYPYGYRYGLYGYRPYGYRYGPYDYSLTPTGKVKAEITPKQTEVHVDGSYAGIADDFDGRSRLHTSPGRHAVTLRLEGYRTVTRDIYVQPNSTYKLTETMETLAPDKVSEPAPVLTVPTRGSDSMTPTPDSGTAPQR